jgi:hypothetical protein
MGGRGDHGLEETTAVGRRLPGLLAVSIGVLLSIGFGAALTVTSGLGHPTAVVEAAPLVAAPGPRSPVLAALPVHLTSTPLPKPARSVPKVAVPPAAPAPPPAAPAPPPAAAPAKVVVRILPAALPAGWSCAAALAYLGARAAPGFTFICPGYALGHQAMTCIDASGVCPGQKVIVIADPCPAAYENEAWNSRVLEGLVSGRLDPYGYCPR